MLESAFKWTLYSRVSRLVYQATKKKGSFNCNFCCGYSIHSKAWPPHVILNMPALSPTMTQGNIGIWKKKIGEAVNPGDVLVEIETDKAQMEYECQDEGFLAKIFLLEGTQDVKIGTPMAILSEKASDVKSFENFVISNGENVKSCENTEITKDEQDRRASAKSSTSKDEPIVEDQNRKFHASPLAKSIGKTKNIDLTSVAGSGPYGRIVAKDINLTSSNAQFPLSDSISSAFKDIPLNNMRKVIASRLSYSKQMIPHYYLTSSIRMDTVLKIREKLNKAAEVDRRQYKLTVNDFMVKASALALQAVPEVNSAWIDSNQETQKQPFIRQFKNSDICVAVATPFGLLTPIIFKAETKGLLEISNEIRALVELARDQKLSPQQYQGGSFTVSNLGMSGGVIDHFTAIINPPQSCILAVGQTSKTVIPLAENGYEIASIMKVTISCDHRVVDGATGALWLKYFKAFLEEPTTMIL